MCLFGAGMIRHKLIVIDALMEGNPEGPIIRPLDNSQDHEK